MTHNHSKDDFTSLLHDNEGHHYCGNATSTSPMEERNQHLSNDDDDDDDEREEKEEDLYHLSELDAKTISSHLLSSHSNTVTATASSLIPKATMVSNQMTTSSIDQQLLQPYLMRSNERAPSIEQITTFTSSEIDNLNANKLNSGVNIGIGNSTNNQEEKKMNLATSNVHNDSLMMQNLISNDNQNSSLPQGEVDFCFQLRLQNQLQAQIQMNQYAQQEQISLMQKHIESQQRKIEEMRAYHELVMRQQKILQDILSSPQLRITPEIYQDIQQSKMINQQQQKSFSFSESLFEGTPVTLQTQPVQIQQQEQRRTSIIGNELTDTAQTKFPMTNMMQMNTSQSSTSPVTTMTALLMQPDASAISQKRGSTAQLNLMLQKSQAPVQSSEQSIPARRSSNSQFINESNVNLSSFEQLSKQLEKQKKSSGRCESITTPTSFTEKEKEEASEVAATSVTNPGEKTLVCRGPIKRKNNKPKEYDSCMMKWILK